MSGSGPSKNINIINSSTFLTEQERRSSADKQDELLRKARIAGEVVVAVVPISGKPSPRELSPVGILRKSASPSPSKALLSPSPSTSNKLRIASKLKIGTSSGSLINTDFQDEEFDKTDLLKQIEVLKGSLERRSSKAFSNDDSIDSHHRRDSRMRSGSISSMDSSGTHESHNSEDMQDKGKNKETEDIRKANEKRKHVDTFFSKATGFFANMDSLASRGNLPRHDFCILFSLYLIPVLVMVFIWDLLAVLVFEIPHLSMIEHPGFMLVLHFICVPTSMYGYMMRALMGLYNTPLTNLGIISVVFHPLFLALRAFIEVYFEGFQSQQHFRYENY